MEELKIGDIIEYEDCYGIIVRIWDDGTMYFKDFQDNFIYIIGIKDVKEVKRVFLGI